jgi:DNA-binding beta-propeller fold protein YncE
LVEIDPATGSSTVVGQTGVGGLASGLAYDPVTGTLYGVATLGGLYRINTSTGSASLIGATGLVFTNAHQGLAFDPETMTLFLNEADTSDSLYTLDAATGAATLVGPNGPTAGFGIDGLTFGVIPEPSTGALLATGLLTLAAASRRDVRRRRGAAGPRSSRC